MSGPSRKAASDNRRGIGKTIRSAEVARRLPTLMNAIEVKQRGLRNQMQRLESAGLIYATPHYRQGKYLYLLFPTTREKGKKSRSRVYIGSQSERISDALKGIERAKEFDRLKRELWLLESGLAQGLRLLQEAITIFETLAVSGLEALARGSK